MIRWSDTSWAEVFARRHEDGTPCHHRRHACGQRREPWRTRLSCRGSTGAADPIRREAGPSETTDEENRS